MYNYKQSVYVIIIQIQQTPEGSARVKNVEVLKVIC